VVAQVHELVRQWLQAVRPSPNLRWHCGTGLDNAC
jgi:hypothetical protein